MNKKQKITIIVCLIVIIFFALLGISKYFGGFLLGPVGEENSEMKFSNNVFTKNAKLTHVIYTSENEVDNVKATIIYTFQNDKCISERLKYIFSTEEIAQDQYDNWSKIPDLTNLEKSGTEVSFNSNVNIGETKQEILDNNTMEYQIF